MPGDGWSWSGIRGPEIPFLPPTSAAERAGMPLRRATDSLPALRTSAAFVGPPAPGPLQWLFRGFLAGPTPGVLSAHPMVRRLLAGSPAAIEPGQRYPVGYLEWAGDALVLRRPGALSLISTTDTLVEFRSAILDQSFDPAETRRLDDLDFVIARPEPQSDRRRIALVLPGVQSSPFQARLLDELMGRGWTVVTISESQEMAYWIDSLDEDAEGPARLRSPAEAAAQADVLLNRVTEGARRAIDMAHAAIRRNAKATRRSGESPAESSAAPPVVVFGISLGGIMAPTVAARLAPTPDAVVIVAGGGDIAAINDQSPILQSAIARHARRIGRFRAGHGDGNRVGDVGGNGNGHGNGDGDGDGNRADSATETARTIRGEIRHTLLAADPLMQNHPLRLAPSLRGIPILMLHATFDAIVPAWSGRRLWHALGRPERWSWPVGHLGLLGLLPGEARRAVDWAESRLVPDPIDAADG
ncbi:MAG: hypothetical protein AB8G96_14180 [Phycisphaerales bacterium]